MMLPKDFKKGKSISHKGNMNIEFDKEIELFEK